MGKIDVPHLFIIDKAGMIRNDFSYSEQDKAVFEGPAFISGNRQTIEVSRPALRNRIHHRNGDDITGEDVLRDVHLCIRIGGQRGR